MEFGEKLQMLRKARGWSQEELAQQINVSRQALSKWESGASIADTENVIALSRLFGVSTDYLLLCESEAASAPAAGSAPTKESKWPVPRIAWLVILLVAVVGLIAMHILASVRYASGLLLSVMFLASRFQLWWLLILLWVMLAAGFLGTVFYRQIAADGPVSK
ncbi:MAG: helix-turn-helix transcriptional regulator [Oscillospiraceae bacterium]|nr:helix-turn-helix transcriptional regulator [Oscillospiraceae bacterium]MBP3699258.1 helix-turn-helix transcriptional regulator [Oscillospiraceae bacterium]